MSRAHRTLVDEDAHQLVFVVRERDGGKDRREAELGGKTEARVHLDVTPSSLSNLCYTPGEGIILKSL